MIYANMNDDTLTCFSPKAEILFTDESCNALFDYVDMDVSEVTELLVRYFTSRIDRNTLAPIEPLDEARSEQILEILLEKLKATHPMFLTAGHVTRLPDMLANTYNMMLLAKEQDTDGPRLPEYEYHRNLSTLISGTFNPYLTGGLFVEEENDSILFCQKYYELYTAGKQNMDKFVNNNIGVVKKWQEQLRLYIYWVLDASATRFQHMTTQSRSKLFQSVFGDIGPAKFTLRECFAPANPSAKDVVRGIIGQANWKALEYVLSLDNETNDEEIEEFAKSISQERNDEIRSMVRDKEMVKNLYSLTSDEIDLDGEINAWLKEKEKSVMESEDNFFHAYEINTFQELTSLQTRMLIENGATVKRCKNCGRHFIAEQINSDYCYRIAEGETQPCNIIGSNRTFARVLENDRCRMVHARTYKRMHARKKRGTIDQEKFDLWQRMSRQHIDDVKEGRWTEDEYEAWSNAQ